MDVVIDTNVIVAALRSRHGASNRLLRLVGGDRFRAVLSVALALEYEEVLLREAAALDLREDDVRAVVDYLCAVGKHQPVFFLWRPFLSDPDDDMLLEVAVAAEAACIVTHNVRDLQPADRFGIRVLTPRQFLQSIGEIP